MPRVPVGVESYTSPDGTLTPTAIVWRDGRRWQVEVDAAESVDAYERGFAKTWRWRVRVMPSGQRKWLWYSVDRGRHEWWVEVAGTMDGRPAPRRDPHDGYIQRPWLQSQPEDPDPDAWGWEPEGWV